LHLSSSVGVEVWHTRLTRVPCLAAGPSAVGQVAVAAAVASGLLGAVALAGDEREARLKRAAAGKALGALKRAKTARGEPTAEGVPGAPLVPAVSVAPVVPGVPAIEALSLEHFPLLRLRGDGPLVSPSATPGTVPPDPEKLNRGNVSLYWSPSVVYLNTLRFIPRYKLPQGARIWGNTDGTIRSQPGGDPNEDPVLKLIGQTLLKRWDKAQACEVPRDDDIVMGALNNFLHIHSVDNKTRELSPSSAMKHMTVRIRIPLPLSR
jgi:hypothetical protein